MRSDVRGGLFSGLLNYIVALYLIIIGIVGLFGPIHIVRW
jgi:DUF3096 family protein